MKFSQLHFWSARRYLFFFVVGFLFFSAPTYAAWVRVGSAGGTPVYRDTATNLEWTATITQVASKEWGASARSIVANKGFRLPSFGELQQAEQHGGSNVLGIRYGLFDFYETSNPNVLVKPIGGIKTPQQRKGTGQNWVIGVRSMAVVNPGGGGSGGTSPPITQQATQQEIAECENVRILMIFGSSDEKFFKVKNNRSLMSISQPALLDMVEASKIPLNQVTILGDKVDEKNEREEGADPNKGNILLNVENLCDQAGPDGAVLVYYLGHGGAKKESDGIWQHYIFPMSTGPGNVVDPIQRDEIMSVLRSANLRFAGLVTDSCSSEFSYTAREAPAAEAPLRFKGAMTPLRAMLVYGRGTVNINSSSRPTGDYEAQSAFWDPEIGSFFTQAFCKDFGSLELIGQNGRFSQNDWSKKKTAVQGKITYWVDQSIKSEDNPERRAKLEEGQEIDDYGTSLK